MKHTERHYKRKQCVVCGNPFQPVYPAEVCCCDECRNVYRKKWWEEYYKTNHKQIKSKQKSCRPSKVCEICGELLENNHSDAHEKCMLKQYLNNYSVLKNDKKYRNYMQNHFATTRADILVYIAEYEFKLDIDLKLETTSIRGSKPVMCVETDEIFGSIKEAAAAKFINIRSIADSAKHNKCTCGYHFKFI